MILIKPVQRRMFYICFGGFLLLLLTISTASNNAFCELMWIEKRNNPGDTATDCAANILTDGLLLYRCYIIWELSLRFWEPSWCVRMRYYNELYYTNGLLGFVTPLRQA